MRTQLHILTRPPARSESELIERIRTEPGLEVRVVDLTVPDPDYPRLLEEIFGADSVVTW